MKEDRIIIGTSPVSMFCNARTAPVLVVDDAINKIIVNGTAQGAGLAVDNPNDRLTVKGTLGTSEIKNPTTITFGSVKANGFLLKIEPSGSIIWNSPKGEIVINDKPLLGVALMDIVSKLSGSIYDLSKIDKDLYKQYQEFLATGEIIWKYTTEIKTLF